jgi:hypothetical protein
MALVPDLGSRFFPAICELFARAEVADGCPPTHQLVATTLAQPEVEGRREGERSTGDSSSSDPDRGQRQAACRGPSRPGRDGAAGDHRRARARPSPTRRFGRLRGAGSALVGARLRPPRSVNSNSGRGADSAFRGAQIRPPTDADSAPREGKIGWPKERRFDTRGAPISHPGDGDSVREKRNSATPRDADSAPRGAPIRHREERRFGPERRESRHPEEGKFGPKEREFDLPTRAVSSLRAAPIPTFGSSGITRPSFAPL